MGLEAFSMSLWLSQKPLAFGVLWIALGPEGNPGVRGDGGSPGQGGTPGLHAFIFFFFSPHLAYIS